MMPIKDILAKINVPDESSAFSPMGRHIAKINLEYLSRCNLYHDLWLGSEFEFKRLTLNGNENIDDNKNLFNEWIPKILNFFEELLSKKLLKKTSNYC